MFIANLMASVLAIAMVGASTASVSKYENNAVRSAENISFVAAPKKAYYQPDEEYNEEPLYYTYYGSNTLKCYAPQNQSYVFEFDMTSGFTYWYTTTQTTGGVTLAFMEPEHDLEGNVLAFTSSISLDFYVNGEFNCTYALDDADLVNGYYCLASPFIDIPDLDTESTYIWIFDHPEPDPYTPVDLLGDIAEGMTGGIVPVAEGIGSGLQSLVQDIFLNAAHDGLSVFGIVIICFAGLALALGLSRWVLNFVDTLGARDR